MRRLIHDIYNAYPIPVDFYKHEFDTAIFQVFFTMNSDYFSIDPTVYDVTAVITINDLIVTEEFSPEIVIDNILHVYGLNMDFSDYELFHGQMKIEFRIIPKSAQDKMTVPVAPLLINITPSILDNASATPQSIGTISDLLQLAPNLKTIVNNDLGAITKSTFDNLELEVGVLYTIGLAQGFLYTNSPAQSGYVVAVSNEYTIIIAALDGVFYVYGAAGARSACDGAIGSHSIQDNAIKSSHIPNYTIAFSQLSQGLQDTINEMGSRITALENTVGTLNDQLETALNGGGS